MSKVVRSVPTHLASNRHVRWGGDVSFGWLSSDIEELPTDSSLPLGVIGDPTGANAHDGKAQWDAIIANLAEAMGEIATWDPRRG
jgi:creatinine amidohydrolase